MEKRAGSQFIPVARASASTAVKIGVWARLGICWHGAKDSFGGGRMALCRRTMGMGWQRLGLRWSVGVEKGGLICENLARRISRRGLKRVLQGILRRRSRVAHPRCRKNPLAAARMRQGWRRRAAGCRSNTHLWGTGAVERGAGWLRTRGPPRLYECLPPVGFWFHAA